MTLNPQSIEAIFIEACDRDPGLLAELIDVYQRSADSLLKEMSRACRHKNVADLRRAAHTLKSSSKMVGADRLAKVCSELEAIAHAGNWDGVEQKLDVVEAQNELIRQDLKTEYHRFCAIGLGKRVTEATTAQ